MDDGRSENGAVPAPNAPEAPAVKDEELKAAETTPLQSYVESDVKRTDASGAINSEKKDGAEPVTAETKEDGKKEEGDDQDEPVSAMREWFDLILRAGFWALILYLFFFQVSVVDGPSMQPNFQTNDRLVIDKVTLVFSSIHRFDVVVFSAVDSEKSQESKDYIKRVIGLPGETVEIKAGKIFIDGKQIEEPFEPNSTPCFFGTEKYVVPPYHYFVMGDNRMDSKDSRVSGMSSGLGFVPYSQIRGIARLRFLPVGRWKWFWRR